MVTLRPCQEKNVQEMREALREHQSVILVAPCGYGKGTVISYIVNRAVERGLRVIFGVHGKALVNDMSQRVARLGIKHGVLMGSRRRERWHPVQVASVDTWHRMEHAPKANIIIADECHMSLSPTWRKTIEQYPEAKLIGCTATPIRLDKQGLGKRSGGLFDSMVLGPTEQELIDDGYLVGSRVLAPPPPADLGGLKKTAGEFNSKQQAAVCDKAKVIGDIVEHWRRHAAGRKTAVFGVDQAHANHIAEQFRQSGVNWAYVDADTPDEEREKIWKDLDAPSGNLMGVSSVGCISVGWDHPIVSCIIAARKTASLGLWRQMLGRGSRTYPGKDHFLVLDHVGNTHYHFPYGMFEDPVDWQLDGEAVRVSMAEKADSVTTCKRPATVDGVLRLPCYATFRTGPTECPYCGIPLVKEARKIESVAGELAEILRSQMPKAESSFMAERRKLYQEFEDTAHLKGYKPGWAALQFHNKTGMWPKREWKAGGSSVVAKALEESLV